CRGAGRTSHRAILQTPRSAGRTALPALHPAARRRKPNPPRHPPPDEPVRVPRRLVRMDQKKGGAKRTGSRSSSSLSYNPAPSESPACENGPRKSEMHAHLAYGQDSAAARQARAVEGYRLPVDDGGRVAVDDREGAVVF